MSQRTKQLRKQRGNKKRRIPATSTVDGPPKPSFQLETLEPRILLSATWVDVDTGDALEGATSGNDSYTGTAGDDIPDGMGGDDMLSGLDGNDTLSGGVGDDTLFGGLGNDQLDGGVGNDSVFGGDGDDLLYGDNHADTLNGGTGNDQLYGGNQDDVLISGGGDDVMYGDKRDDIFRFTGAQNADVITVDGGQHNDTIDLSSYGNSQISDNGSTITVDMGGGQSFTVNYINVENIMTAEGTYSPGGVPAGNQAPDAVDDSVTTNENSAVTTGNVLSNDTDSDADTLSITGFTHASNGTVVNNGDGTFTYTPNANFIGTDSFTYTVPDGNGGTDTATVNVTVNAVADAPASGSGDAVAAVDVAPDTGQGVANDSDSTGGEQASGMRSEDGPTTMTDARPDGSVGESSKTETAERLENENPADTDAGNASDAVAVQPDGARSDGARPDTVRPDEVVVQPPGTTPAGSEQPASSHNEDQGNSGAVTWDGTEDLRVLNPMEEMDDKLEVAQAEFAVLEGMNDAIGAEHADAARIDDEFDLVSVVELPRGAPVANMTTSVAAPAMGTASNAPWDGGVGSRVSQSAAVVAGASATVEEAAATSSRRRHAEEESGAEVVMPGAGDEAVSASGAADDTGAPLNRAAGFLAGLWSAVRAGAGTAKHSEDEDSAKLGRGRRR